MARQRRVDFKGAIHHVTSRGVRKRDIFFCPPDRLHWLNVFARTCEKYSLKCLAYCQMGNHFHIVVESGQGDLAKAMGMLNSSYAQYINQLQGTVGHAFQARYHADLVDRDSYFLELLRYVLLNPVRAGIVADPRDWPWSSYRATLGLEPTPIWLDAARVLRMFGVTPAPAATRLREFILAGIERTKERPTAAPDPVPGGVPPS